MKNRILAELDFASILNESSAQTATGADLLRKYQSFLITNESSGSSKYKKAIELNIPIITEEKFLNMIGD